MWEIEHRGSKAETRKRKAEMRRPARLAVRVIQARADGRLLRSGGSQPGVILSPGHIWQCLETKTAAQNRQLYPILRRDQAE